MSEIFSIKCRWFLVAFLTSLLSANSVLAQGTAFTYQGRLTDGGTPANGTYDAQFKLFDTQAVGTGTQIGPTITNPTITVTAGIFTVQLDFGAGAFPGADRFLEINVRLAGSGSAYTTLSPRQPVTATPYAIRSANSATADAATTATNATQLGGVAANQYVQTGDSRLSDARPPTAGSANYIQNTNVQQASSNFNISGNGTAGGTLSGNFVEATTQFNIAGFRVLSVAGTANMFVGLSSGTSNTTGSDNAFFGEFAGQMNTEGYHNAFFGRGAGNKNTTGASNAFFGRDAGFSNTTGAANAFFGTDAGASNTTANGNAFFGYGAGNLNTTGGGNAFFGKGAGQLNTTGNENAFFGYGAGFSNTASSNAFFGYGAGNLNTTGGGNAFFGRNTGLLNTTGNDNAFFGYLAGQQSTGSNNAFFGRGAGISNTTGTYNTFFGSGAGNTNTTGNSNTIIGGDADVAVGNLSFATAIGSNAIVSNSNSVVLGRSADTVRIPGSLVVTGSVSKGSGSFTIDDPLDPENKTLSHSFVESPDMMNIYNGNAVLDRRGRAIVTMPAYFQALNREFRYQLTAVGAPAPNLHIAREIQGNCFQIAGGKPGTKVSWQVTGIRHDPYAEAHRVRVEEEKPLAERGTYLHPDVYQQTSTRARQRRP